MLRVITVRVRGVSAAVRVRGASAAYPRSTRTLIIAPTHSSAMTTAIQSLVRGLPSRSVTMPFCAEPVNAAAVSVHCDRSTLTVTPLKFDVKQRLKER